MDILKWCQNDADNVAVDSGARLSCTTMRALAQGTSKKRIRNQSPKPETAKLIHLGSRITIIIIIIIQV